MAQKFFTWSPLVSFANGHVFLPSAAPDGSGDIDIAFASTTSPNPDEPWTVTLTHTATDAFGNPLYPATTVATYTVPAPDTANDVAFDFAYGSLETATNRNMTLWTEAVGTFASTDTSELLMQRYNDAGTAIGSTVALNLLGSSANMKYLFDTGFSSGPDFGKSFMVAYSTFNPDSNVAQISYEEFSASGAALKHGTLYSSTDQSPHAITFGTYYLSDAAKPAYLLMYHLPEGATGAVHVELLNTDGTQGAFNFDLPVLGPDGEGSTVIHNFGFAKPDSIDPKGNYGVLTETFGYQDAGGQDHFEAALQVIAANGHVTAQSEIHVTSDEELRIVHLTNGDIAVGYGADGVTHIAEYTAGLTPAGAAFNLPSSSGELADLISLDDGRIEAFWRDGSDTSGTLDSIILDTRTAAVTIDDSSAATGQSIAGTLFADTLTGSNLNDDIEGSGGNDVITPGKGNDIVLGGTGNDRIVMGANLTAADSIDGGTGIDTVVLNGDYTKGVTFSATTMVNVEDLELVQGHSYTLVMNAATVAGGGVLSVTLDVNAKPSPLDVLHFDGSAVTGGSFAITAGAGDDVIVGGALKDTIVAGAGNNTITGGGGADSITAGSGADTFVYHAVSDSIGATFDTISSVNFSNDRFDVMQPVNAIDPALTSGTLTLSTFTLDLQNAMKGVLQAHDAILFEPDKGSLAGHVFLVIDQNGTAGYQSSGDLVIALSGTTGTLSQSDFT